MSHKQIKKVLIVGAGEAGIDVANEIQLNPDLNLKVVGFIDDDKGKHGKKINNVLVLGNAKNLVEILSKKRFYEVIIAIPSADGLAIAKYVKICTNARVAVRIVPRVKEIIEGIAHVKAIREVRVEDLLGRPVVKSDVYSLQDFFQDKTVLITGAAGSIGSELSRQVAAYAPKRLILLDWWENGLFDIEQELKNVDKNKVEIIFSICSIRDKSRVSKIFEQYKPDYVFHAAAYKHVPLMELHPSEAIKNNVIGTLNVATASEKTGVSRFVLISSDKAAHPISVMGATKLITEGIGKKLNGSTKFMAVRFGNVLDSFGSVIPTFRKQIAKGGPVTITDKRMRRYFMTIPEAAQLILKAAQIGTGGELFVLDMGEPVKIYDLAENMIRLSGYIPTRDIEIVITGKRPGEKLRERLFNNKEKLLPTLEKKIFVTETLGFNIKKLEESIKKLKEHAEREDDLNVRKELARLISSFKVR